MCLVVNKRTAPLRDFGEVCKNTNFVFFLLNKKVMSSCLYFTIATYSYKDLLNNLIWSIEHNTKIKDKFVVFTFEEKLYQYLVSKHKGINICYMPFSMLKGIDFSNPVSFKDKYWNEINLYKLHVIWSILFVKNHTMVWINEVVKDMNELVYIDPDIYFYQDPEWFIGSLKEKGVDMAMQEDKPYCAGLIYVTDNKLTRTIMNPDEWTSCKTDDQTYLRQAIQKYQIKAPPNEKGIIDVFPQTLFPNGLAFTQLKEDRILSNIKLNKYVAFHFNYLRGLQMKIDKMIEYKAWLKPMEIVEVPECFRENLNQICIDKHGVTYPPHQGSEEHLEEYIHKYVEKTLINQRVISNFNYLPVYWTSIGVKKDTKIIQQLKTFIDQLVKNNPNQKYWTVVQHCNGVYGSCGIWLDSNIFKIFGTTKKSSSEQPGKVIRYGSGGKTSQIQAYSVNKIEHISVIIPLLSAPHKNKPIFGRDIIFERPLIASFIGNVNTHPIRQQMQRALMKKDRVVIEFGNYKEEGDKNRFSELMSKSIFALCPRGVGSTSFRLAEAMEFGCIPVYISDTFSLPFDKIINWDNIIVKVKPTEINSLYNTLSSKASNSQWLYTRQLNVKKIYEDYFKMDKCAKTILEMMDESKIETNCAV